MRTSISHRRRTVSSYFHSSAYTHCIFTYGWTSFPADNIFQEAVWHLTQGDLTVTPEAEAKKDQALEDINALRKALRTLLSSVMSSVTSEGTSLFQDLLSVIRLSLAEAAGVIEGQAESVKETLLQIEEEVQDGKRDTLGRDKQRLEKEKDPKIAWQHGMDTVKDAGTTVISTAQETSETIEEKADKTSARLREAFRKVCVSCHEARAKQLIVRIDGRQSAI
jgi:hypothetical protein